MSLLFALADLSNELKQQYRRFPAKDSTLDIDFINNRQRVAGAQGAALDGVTFTRSTTATYFGADGLLKTAAINEPRFEYDPILLRPLGLLIEESRANILLNSDVGATQSVSVSATPYTLSFWGTGTVTLSGVSTAGPLVGTGDNTRVTLTFTPTAGTLTLTVSGTVTKWQLEAGNFATSYIPTTSASVTRGGEVVKINDPVFSSFYSHVAGTLLATVYNPRGVVVFGTGGTFADCDYVAVGETYNVPIRANNVDVVALTAPVRSGMLNTVCYAYGQSFGACSSLSVPNTSAQSVSLANRVRLSIGSSSWDTSAGNNVNGHMQRVIYYPKRLPNNLLQYLSRLTA